MVVRQSELVSVDYTPREAYSLNRTATACLPRLCDWTAEVGKSRGELDVTLWRAESFDPEEGRGI